MAIEHSTNPRGPLGEPAVVEFLRILRREMAQSLVPELTSDRSKTFVGMAVSLLDYLILREDGLEPILQQRSEHVREALRDLGSNDTPSLDSLERTLTACLLKHADPDHHANIDTVVNRLMQQESAYLGALAPRPSVTPPPASVSKAGMSIAERISAYLQAQRKDGAPVKVSSLGSPLGGYSKDVFVANLEGAGRPADRVVIRRDRPLGPLETSVAAEYQVLKAADDAGVPVATPLYFEPDANVLGTPFLVLKFVEGSAGGDFMRNVQQGMDPSAVFRELAGIVGRIHSIDPAAAGIPAAELARPLNAHVVDLLDRFEEQWRRRRSAPSPVLASALAWMRAHLPPDGSGQAVVVHADPTPRNLLLRDGRVTAILDWETWHVGDPAEDLAYCKDEIAGHFDWNEFLTLYKAAGGRAVDERRIDYWMMWKYLFGSISSVSMMEGIGIDPKTDLRTAFGAIYFTQYCVNRVAERLAQVTAPN